MPRSAATSSTPRRAGRESLPGPHTAAHPTRPALQWIADQEQLKAECLRAAGVTGDELDRAIQSWPGSLCDLRDGLAAGRLEIVGGRVLRAPWRVVDSETFAATARELFPPWYLRLARWVRGRLADAR